MCLSWFFFLLSLKPKSIQKREQRIAKEIERKKGKKRDREGRQRRWRQQYHTYHQLVLILFNILVTCTTWLCLCVCFIQQSFCREHLTVIIVVVVGLLNLYYFIHFVSLSGVCCCFCIYFIMLHR